MVDLADLPFLICLLALLSGGCSDDLTAADPWRFGDPEDPGDPEDKHQIGECDREDRGAWRYETRYLEGLHSDTFGGDHTPPIALHDGKVWLKIRTRQRRHAGGDNPRDVLRRRVRLHRYRWDDETRQVVPLPDFLQLQEAQGYTERLVTAGPDRRLLLSRVRTGPGERREYFWMEGASAEEDSEDRQLVGPPHQLPAGASVSDTRDPKNQIISSPWAVWEERCDANRQEKVCLHITNLREEGSHHVRISGPLPSPPAIRDGWVAWLEPRPDSRGQRLMLEGDGETRTIARTDSRRHLSDPVLADNHLYWLQERALHYVHLDSVADGRVSPAGTGADGCSELRFGGGSRAIAICDAGGQDSDQPRDVLWIVHDDGVRRIGVSDGAVRDVVLKGDRLAWLEFPVGPDADSCAAGRVRIASLDDPERTTTVGGVAVPCSDLPVSSSPTVWLDGPFVAWNFAQPPEASSSDAEDTGGVARIDWTSCGEGF